MYMHTFQIDFHINPYIADIDNLTQFWSGNLFSTMFPPNYPLIGFYTILFTQF